jgi:hypothetical protein
MMIRSMPTTARLQQRHDHLTIVEIVHSFAWQVSQGFAAEKLPSGHRPVGSTWVLHSGACNSESNRRGCARSGTRWRTGNGTNSARRVYKLRSRGNRKVNKRSWAKGWKQT